MDNDRSAGDRDDSRGTAAERATLLIAVSSASVAFALAFNFGAFNTVFFGPVFTVWIIASIVLFGSLVSSLPPQSWAGRSILLIPSFWVLASWIVDGTVESVASNYVFTAAIIVTLICLPFIAWILISTINPEFLALPRGNKAAIIGVVLMFAVLGFLIGARNDIFLTCDDFKVSGNDLPSNCVSGSEAPNPGG